MIKKFVLRFREMLNEARTFLLKRKYGVPHSCRVYFGKRVRIVNAHYIKWLGDHVSFDDDVELCINKTMEMTPQLCIGNRVSFGKMNRIGCDNKIIIEDDVLFAPHVHITDRNHGFEDVNRPISKQEITSKGPVVIGAETWVGFGVQVMSGVRIGKHCVIAAGAVVIKNVPDYCVVGGNPARILKCYNQKTKMWEKYYGKI